MTVVSLDVMKVVSTVEKMAVLMDVRTVVSMVDMMDVQTVVVLVAQMDKKLVVLKDKKTVVLMDITMAVVSDLKNPDYAPVLPILTHSVIRLETLNISQFKHHPPFPSSGAGGRAESSITKQAALCSADAKARIASGCIRLI